MQKVRQERGIPVDDIVIPGAEFIKVLQQGRPPTVRHWHVGHNPPGFLPVEDPEIYTSGRDARARVSELGYQFPGEEIFCDECYDTREDCRAGDSEL